MDKKVELQVLNITNSQAQVGAFAMLLGEVAYHFLVTRWHGRLSAACGKQAC